MIHLFNPEFAQSAELLIGINKASYVIGILSLIFFVVSGASEFRNALNFRKLEGKQREMFLEFLPKIILMFVLGTLLTAFGYITSIVIVAGALIVGLPLALYTVGSGSSILFEEQRSKAS